MDEQRAPHLPAKARLSWHISRLSLEPGGGYWLATASKGGSVAVIQLPPLLDPNEEGAWLAEIEARFEAHRFDPLQADYLGSAPDHVPNCRAELALSGSSVYPERYVDARRPVVGAGTAAAPEKARGQW